MSKKRLATLAVAAALLLGIAAPASATHLGGHNQDGLVNVAVGDITILEDVNIGVAAQAAANVCGLKVGPVAVLGTAVDRSGDTETVCTTDQGDVTLEQNIADPPSEDDPQAGHQQDGLVNVAIGDVTILEDVNIGVAAQLAANVCGLKVGPVAVLGTAVDRSGDTATVCESDQGDVTLVQN